MARGRLLSGANAGLLAALVLCILPAVLGASVQQESTQEKEESTPHDVSTLDAAVGPLKDTFTKYIVQIGKNSGVCPDTPATREQVKDGFINFTRLYQSVDFPRDLTRDYAAVPVMLYISCVFFIAWVVLVIIFCFLRCCLRKTRICSPVLRSPKGKRERYECVCLTFYVIALIFFCLATLFFLIAPLILPGIKKDVEKGVVDPFHAYVSNLGARLDKFTEDVVKLPGDIVSGVVNDMDFTAMATAAGGMLDVVLGEFMKAIDKFIENYDEAMGTGKTETLIKKINDVVGQLESINCEEMEKSIGMEKAKCEGIQENAKKIKGMIQTPDETNKKGCSIDISEASNYKGCLLNKEDLIKVLRETILGIAVSMFNLDGETYEKISWDTACETPPKNSDGGLMSAVNLKCAINTAVACVFDKDKRGDGVFTCIISDLDKMFDIEGLQKYVTNKANKYTDRITDPVDEYADKIEKYTEYFEKIIEVLKNYFDGNGDSLYKDIMEIINKLLGDENSEDAEGNSLASIHADESESQDVAEKWVNFALKFIGNTPWVTCLVSVVLLVLLYILPISLAIGLRKRNKKYGKCQCKACIKCTTCGVAAFVPFVFVIVCFLGIAFAIVYFVAVAILLNSDSSNFGEKVVVSTNNGQLSRKVIAPPIGDMFQTCLTKGYMRKSYLFQRIVGKYYTFDEDVSSSESTTAELKRRIKNLAIELSGDILPSVLICADPSAGAATAKAASGDNGVEVKVDDSAYMAKYGTFLSAIPFQATIDSVLKTVVTTDNLKKALKKIGLDDPPEGKDYDILLYNIYTRLENKYNKLVMDETNGVKKQMENAVNQIKVSDDVNKSLKDNKGKLDEVYSIIRLKDSYPESSEEDSDKKFWFKMYNKLTFSLPSMPVDLEDTCKSIDTKIHEIPGFENRNFKRPELRINNEGTNLGDMICAYKDVINDAAKNENVQKDIETILSYCIVEGDNKGKWDYDKSDESSSTLENDTFLGSLNAITEKLDTEIKGIDITKEGCDNNTCIEGRIQGAEATLQKNIDSIIVYKMITEIDKKAKDIRPTVKDFRGMIYNILDIVKTLDTFGKEEKEVVNDIPEKILPYETYNEQAVKSGSTSGLDALMDTLRDSANGIQKWANSFDKYSYGGLFSCYPLGSATETMVGAANTFSHSFTLETIAIWFMFIGCLIMIVVANMGPMVYHKRYLYKRRCCGYSSEYEADVDGEVSDDSDSYDGNVVVPAEISLHGNSQSSSNSSNDSTTGNSNSNSSSSSSSSSDKSSSSSSSSNTRESDNSYDAVGQGTSEESNPRPGLYSSSEGVEKNEDGMYSSKQIYSEGSVYENSDEPSLNVK